MRSRSWIQHPVRSDTHYSQRLPSTPSNTAQEKGAPTRPTLARFSDSLYYGSNIATDTCKEITIPRVLSQGKTPQNIDNTSGRNSASVSSSCSEIRAAINPPQPKSPVIMYTELQFPPNKSAIQHQRVLKGSNTSDGTHPKLSTEIGRFEQGVVRSKGDMFITNHHNFSHLADSSTDAITNRQFISSNGRVDV